MFLKFFTTATVIAMAISTANAADFTIELVPATGSVGTNQVSLIDASKITNLKLKVPGEVFTFAGTSCPSTFSLLADGSSFPKSGIYADLYAAIGDSHGAAGLNFNVPDYRGRFLRMVDGTAGRDLQKSTRSAMNPGGAVGNLVGSVQSSATARPTTPFVTGVESNDHYHLQSNSNGSGGGTLPAHVIPNNFASNTIATSGAN